MKTFTATVSAALSLLVTGCAHAPHLVSDRREPRTPTLEDIGAVSPALERYTRERLLGEVWARGELSPRDRGLVTLAAVISRNHTVEMPRSMALALRSGVTAGELSEVITHLAFYSGWGSAMSAVAAAKTVFEERGIGRADLPSAQGELSPLDEAAEAQRAARVSESFGAIAPGVVTYTTDLLFHELWLRKGLAPRDRSLVTVAALIATGQTAQVPYHLERAMDRGLTKAQVSEMLTQLAFYAGWPSVFSALPVVLPVVDRVLAKRPG